MRVTDATLLGLIGLAAAGVLVATASGLFADPPPDVTGAARQRPGKERTAPPLVDPAPVAQTPLTEAAATSPVRAQAGPTEQGEWRFPALPDVKAALPREAVDNLQRPAAVVAPGEQQAAWAARDKLANAGRARDRPAASPLLTRPHEGPSPDKTGADR